jgi:hypothetical protein
MRTNTLHQTVAIVLFGVSILGIVFAIDSPSAKTSQRRRPSARAMQCPIGIKQFDRCVLTKDEELTTTLRLASDTKLNCNGHKLTPSTTGSGLASRSVPEVSIFLNGVKSVQIEN